MSNTTSNLDLLALADRPAPTVAVTDPFERCREDGDPVRKNAGRAAAEAAEEYATLLSGTAAEMVREMLPSAHRVVFEKTESVDDGVNADLLAVFDAAGDMLWCSYSFEHHSAEVARSNAEAYGGPVKPMLDRDSQQAIEMLIAYAEDQAGGYYPSADDRFPATGRNGEPIEEIWDGDLHDFLVDKEIEAADTIRHAARVTRILAVAHKALDVLILAYIVVACVVLVYFANRG